MMENERFIEEYKECNFGQFFETCDLGMLRDSVELIAKAAYMAGWKDAGGEGLKPEEVKRLFAGEQDWF